MLNEDRSLHNTILWVLLFIFYAISMSLFATNSPFARLMLEPSIILHFTRIHTGP